MLADTQPVFLYWALLIATTSVNKYVLSVLNFTYPTLFQGWQTLAGAVTLRILTVSGKVGIELSPVTLSSVAPWLPGMILYVCSIYSGSVALSKLSVPVFLCLQNVISFIVAIEEVILDKKIISGGKYLMLMLILVSSVFLAITDPLYAHDGYFWMILHLLSTGGYIVYDRLFSNKFTLGDMDRIYCNFIYSVIILAPSSYFLGDLMGAQKFPFWDLYRFYVGCFLSGLFGVLLLVYYTKLKKNSYILTAEQSNAIGKIIAAMVSLAFFDIILTANHTFCLLVNMVAGILVTDTAQHFVNPTQNGGLQQHPEQQTI